MIKFIIDRIHLRNVRNYGDEGMDMDFPLGNLTVFTGHVGAGKSTILKSISMALYGDDGGVKGEKLAIDDMVNERNGKNLEIELYFHSIDTLNDNHQDNYEIHLYHKHSKHQNKLVFMKNGVDISANGKMDTYRLIEKTIIPKDVYHNIYYFTQQAKNFFTALPNSEQKAIFDSILDLSDYDRYYQNCRNNITEYESQLSKCELELNLLESAVKEKERLIQGEKDNIATLKTQNETELSQLKSRLEELKSQITKLKEESALDFNVAEIDKQLAELTAQLTSLDSNYNHEIEALNSKAEEIKSKVQQKFSEAKVKTKEDLEPKLKEIQDKIHDAEQQQFNLNKELSDKIAELKQKATKDISDIELKYAQKISDLKTEISELSNKIISEKSEADKQALELKTAAEKLKSDRDREINQLKVQITENQGKLQQIDKDISVKTDIVERNNKELSSDHPHCDKCGQPLVNMDHLTAENQKLQTELDDLKKQKVDLENIITKLTANVKTVTDACEVQLDTLRERFKVIADNYSKKKMEIEGQVSTKQKELDSINSQKTLDIQTVNSESDRKIGDISSEYKTKIDQVVNSIESLKQSSELETTKAKQVLLEFSQKLTEKQNEALKKVDELVVQRRNEKTKKYDEINATMTTLKSKKLQQETVETRIKDFESQVQQTQMQINLKSEFKPSEDTLESLIQSKAHDEDALSVQVKRHDELKKTLEILEFWKTAFSDAGIKSMLIDVAIPHMNRCVREELDRVCPGTFTVSFDTLSQTKSGTIRDKFAINITHNLKCATGHKKLSGGEKRIIDFCCMSALRSLAEKLYGKMFCHILYDEVLDSLDSESRELFCRSMKTQSSDERHVLLVTHALTEDVEPDRVFPF